MLPDTWRADLHGRDRLQRAGGADRVDDVAARDGGGRDRGLRTGLSVAVVRVAADRRSTPSDDRSATSAFFMAFRPRRPQPS